VHEEEQVSNVETELQHADGSFRWVLLSAGRMPWNTGIFSVVDITTGNGQKKISSADGGTGTARA
jgi:hypothetical protein